MTLSHTFATDEGYSLVAYSLRFPFTTATPFALSPRQPHSTSPHPLRQCPKLNYRIKLIAAVDLTKNVFHRTVLWGSNSPVLVIKYDGRMSLTWGKSPLLLILIFKEQTVFGLIEIWCPQEIESRGSAYKKDHVWRLRHMLGAKSLNMYPHFNFSWQKVFTVGIYKI